MGLEEGKLDLNQHERHRTAYVGRRRSTILCSSHFEALMLSVVKGLLLLFSFSPLVVFGEHEAVYSHAFGSSRILCTKPRLIEGELLSFCIAESR